MLTTWMECYHADLGDTIANGATLAARWDAERKAWAFFIERVRSNLHLSLCFSPVGVKFSTRAQQFPGLVNGTTIDWFLTWPKDALTEVAMRFLSGKEGDDEEEGAKDARKLAEAERARAANAEVALAAPPLPPLDAAAPPVDDESYDYYYGEDDAPAPERYSSRRQALRNSRYRPGAVARHRG